MTGENIELAENALPFLVNQALDCLQPDLVNSGGITGVKKMADLAALFRIPIHLHNVSGRGPEHGLATSDPAAIFNAPLMECTATPTRRRRRRRTPR